VARSFVLVGLALCSLLPACRGCGKKTAPARALDASASSIETRTMRRMATDRSTVKLRTLTDLVKDTTVDPTGATPVDEGELVRLKGTVLEVKETYVLFQDGTYAASCDLPASVAAQVTKGAPIEVTGFYLRGGGHVAARITQCEIARRGEAPASSP
jgi:hypothetical protein